MKSGFCGRDFGGGFDRMTMEKNSYPGANFKKRIILNKVENIKGIFVFVRREYVFF